MTVNTACEVEIPDEDEIADDVGLADTMKEFECVDCSVNTAAIDEYYMVTDEVWCGQAGMHKMGGMLCIGCLEKRIGRQLVAADFPDYPINWMTNVFEHSERLASRIAATETRAAA